MKKALLSLSLIFIFTAYALYVRIMGTDAPIVFLNTTTNSLSVQNQKPTSATQAGKPTPTTPPKPGSISVPPPVVNTGKYKNGSYVGNPVDAYYGTVQVKAIISGGKISDVQFLNYPQDRQNSVRINSIAMPYLIREAIVAQDANVNGVSGASFTSAAYVESLSSALAQAKI